MSNINNGERIILEYIINYKQVNQFSPSNHDIQIGINCRSKSYITQNLETLRDKGYISYYENQPRTIKVIKFK